MLYIPFPEPAHGFLPIGLLTIGYLAVVLGVSVGLSVLGAPSLVVGLAAIATTAVLLKPFLSVSRRLMPDPPGAE